jgi:hypothetical protein
VNASGLQIGNNAHAAKLLVLLAVGRVRGSVGGIVEVFLLLESRNYGLDHRLARIAFRQALPQQTLEFGYAAHLPGKRPNGIFIERVQIVGLAAVERHQDISPQNAAIARGDGQKENFTYRRLTPDKPPI